MNETTYKIAVAAAGAILVGSLADFVATYRAMSTEKKEIEQKKNAEIAAIRQAKAVMVERLKSSDYRPETPRQVYEDLEFEIIIAFNAE
jgi:hypothetical protein